MCVKGGRGGGRGRERDNDTEGGKVGGRELERERTYLEAQAGEEEDERDADGVHGQLGLERAADASKLYVIVLKNQNKESEIVICFVFLCPYPTSRHFFFPAFLVISSSLPPLTLSLPISPSSSLPSFPFLLTCGLCAARRMETIMPATKK